MSPVSGCVAVTHPRLRGGVWVGLLKRGVAATFVSQCQRDLVQVVHSIDEAPAVLRDATVNLSIPRKESGL